MHSCGKQMVGYFLLCFLVYTSSIRSETGLFSGVFAASSSGSNPEKLCSTHALLNEGMIGQPDSVVPKLCSHLRVLWTEKAWGPLPYCLHHSASQTQAVSPWDWIVPRWQQDPA